ncbi:hypothetical protein M0811_09049 [Anaeramoeba ignava]|uniref:Uncharacterized protein n=1 Tax=Anaeramoeba ignava TaxID=1746090 RepID=A0A9Q0RBV2_ANAIG|nr:hypothetical protein M0811_09049 [Anaeramoeba ignava]
MISQYLDQNLSPQIDSTQKIISDFRSSLKKILTHNSNLGNENEKLINKITEFSKLEKSELHDILNNFNHSLSQIENQRKIMFSKQRSQIIIPLKKFTFSSKEIKSLEKKIEILFQKGFSKKIIQEKLSPKERNKEEEEKEMEEIKEEIKPLINEFNEKSEIFEQKKIHILIKMMKNFTFNQLVFHAKSLEILTLINSNLMKFDEDQYIENKMKEIFNLEQIIEDLGFNLDPETESF